MAEEKNKILKEAEREVNYLTGDAETRRLAELREKWDFDWNWSIGYAKKEGREKGKEEGKKETAKKLLLRKMSVEEIADITDLSEEEIEKIKNEMK